MDMDKGIIHYNISGFNRFVWNKSDMFLKMVMNQRFVIIYKKTSGIRRNITRIEIHRKMAHSGRIILPNSLAGDQSISERAQRPEKKYTIPKINSIV